MDLYEDGRCARHATFNISAAGMDSMHMLMMQVSTCVHLVLLAEPGSTVLTLTMRYVRCGAGVSTVSLRTHRILALGD